MVVKPLAKFVEVWKKRTRQEEMVQRNGEKRPLNNFIAQHFMTSVLVQNTVAGEHSSDQLGYH